MHPGTVFVMTHEPDPHRTVKSLSVQALAVTRSLGRRGVRVVRVHPNELESGLASRYCTTTEICPDMYDSELHLVEHLERLSTRYPPPRILLPVTDDCALFVSRHGERLSRCFSLPTPPWSVMEGIVDKRRQYEAAQRIGVPIPETHYPADRAEVRALAPELRNFPYVIKPLVAHHWRLASMRSISGGRKAIRVGTGAELVEAYDALGREAGGVMLQEVIGGGDERLFTFLAYLDRASQPLGYCVRSKFRQWPVDFGYCTLTVSCDQPTVLEQSLRLLQGLHYHGIVGVEWKHDPRTGLFKLIEINARPVNTIGLSIAAGVDLPYLAYRDAIGDPPAAVRTWTRGVKWIRLTQDVSAAWTLHRLGRLTWAEWRESWRGKLVDAVFAWDDPLPFLSDCAASLKRRLNRRGRRRAGVPPRALGRRTSAHDRDLPAPNAARLGMSRTKGPQANPLP